MAYNALNNLIDAYIYANGVQAITGQILNGVLKQMVAQLGSGYHLMGVATPQTVPATDDYAMAYFAATAGEYTNFGGITLAAGEVAVLLTSGNGSWSKQTIYNIPTGTADLENTAEFITNSVTDLVNYYTKTEVDDTLANYPTLEALATALADYYTKTEIDTILADYTTNTALASALADYYNKNDIDGLLSVVNAALADRYTKDETDTKLADYYKKTETYDKDEVDSIVATLSRQEYIVAWDGSSAPDVTAIPAGVTVTYSGTTYTGTLAASASTVNKIYMVWNGTAYDMYGTSQDGGYSWVPMGTTTVDLSQYATKAELSQLEAKVDGTPANYLENYKLNASNELIPAEGYAVTDFVPYTSGNDVLWRFDTANRQYYILFYNSNKEFINGSDWTADYDSTNQGRLIPSSQIASYARGAAYLRATFTIAYTDAQVKVGNEIRWTPQAEIVSLTEQVAEAEEKASKAVSFIEQDLSPNEQNVTRENISIDDRLFGSSLNYLSNVRITQGTLWEETGMCVTDFIPIKNGDDVIWNFGVVGQSNYTLSLYDENKNYSNFYSSNNYVGSRTITISSDTYKYLRATFKKTTWNGQKNNFPIVVNGVYFPYKDNVPSFFEHIKRNIDDKKRWKPLVFGGLVNSDTTTNGHLIHSDYYDPLRVTTKSVVTPPFPGAIIRFRFVKDVPYTLSCYFFVGNSADVMNTTWDGYKRLYNGTIIKLPDSARSIRPVFRASDSASGFTVAILASTIQGWLDEGTLAIEYYDEDKADVLERNIAIDANMAALRRKLIWSNMSENGMDSMPVFAHITDLHGDATRFDNFLTYCDRNRVDFALETGDALMHQHRDSSEFIYDLSIKHKTDVLVCIGNHESLPTGSSTLFEDNIYKLANEYDYLSEPGISAAKCYYYKDFDSKKIRVIVLNQYEDGVYAMRLGQTQITWFVATLASIPEGYGVVVMLHAPDDAVVADSPYNTFFQPVPHSTSYPGGYYVDKRAISMIVDAFISRTAISFTFNDHSATYNGDTDLTTENISVSADFTAVNPNTEFICYVCGHRHEDRIGYFENSVNKQLCLEITCGSALYGDASNPAWSNQSDLPRGGVGVSQDAFCIYAIDRLNGNVKVIRVGATVTQMMAKREMMVIPYKD